MAHDIDVKTAILSETEQYFAVVFKDKCLNSCNHMCYNTVKTRGTEDDT